MGILVSLRFMSTQRIRRIPLSRVLTVLMIIGVCLLVCVMHLLLFRGVCLLYFMVSVRRLLRSMDEFCRDVKKKLVLNWEKCHLMVNEGIVLGHKISERGIE